MLRIDVNSLESVFKKNAEYKNEENREREILTNGKSKKKKKK